MAAVRHQSRDAALWPEWGTLTSWENPVESAGFWFRASCDRDHGGRVLVVHPLRPPALRPDRMLRWKIRKKMIVGIAAMAEAAMMRFSVVVVAPVIPTLIVSLVGV